MGYGINQDGVCNTGLGLGLISGTSCHENRCSDQQQKKKRINLKYDDDDDGDGIFPSLTLGLIPPHQELGSELPVSSSPISTAVSNSLSNSSVKKERDQFDQLEAVENEDEEGSPRKKLRLTKQQSAVLEDNFKEHTTLNPKQKQALAEQLNLRPRQVEVWFQNRRARTKLKQTEVDCEVLKKCCERLTEENKKLQKEVQELKSMNMAAPVYMHLPAATLSLCPSCDRIGAAAAATGDGSAPTTLTVGTVPKPHLYSPFTHHSAAC